MTLTNGDSGERNGNIYQPEDLAKVSQAFEEAWNVIEGEFADNGHFIEDARDALAQAVLAAFDEGIKDVNSLKEAAAISARAPSVRPTASALTKDYKIAPNIGVLFGLTSATHE